MFRVLVAACFGIAMFAGVAQSAVLNVNAKANGGFGSSSGGTLGTAMVPFNIAGAGTFQITASGTISICDACGGAYVAVPPGGLTFPDTPFGNGEILPLEERDGIDPDPSNFAGALIGAFVAQGTPGTAGFDMDIGGDIPDSALFLIGAGPFLFNAPGAGTLYLGINDSFVANDSGFFTVTIEQVRNVPEPASLVLLGFGLAAVAVARRRDF